MREAGKSRQEEVVECLAGFPDGAMVDEVRAFFDHVGTREYFERQLRRLVMAGVVVKIVPTRRKAFAGAYERGPIRRIKFRLAAGVPASQSGESGTAPVKQSEAGR